MEIKDNIDLGRGLSMSPSRKRMPEDNLESGVRKGRKLKYQVIRGEQKEGAEDVNKDNSTSKDDHKEQRQARTGR